MRTIFFLVEVYHTFKKPLKKETQTEKWAKLILIYDFIFNCELRLTVPSKTLEKRNSNKEMGELLT